MLKKLTIVAVAAAFAAMPLPSLAQGKKDSVVMGMTLEPPGLDPTNAAAAAIAEVTLYNLYETLTKINENGSVSPLLAESWTRVGRPQDLYIQAPQGRSNSITVSRSILRRSSSRLSATPRRPAPTRTRACTRPLRSVTAPDAETVVVAVKYPNRTCRSCSVRQAARSSSRRARRPMRRSRLAPDPIRWAPGPRDHRSP